MFARRGVALTIAHIGVFSTARTTCDPKKPKKIPLMDIIPPFKSNQKGSFVNEITCATWGNECAQDYQKLQYGPTNFLTIIAFLRLLGAEEISLAQISYNIITRKAYINQLPTLPEKMVPILMNDVPRAFLSIKELHPNTKPKSRDMTIENVLHILPSLVAQATIEFDNDAISTLYHAVSELSDDDIQVFVDHFSPDQNAKLKDDLNQRLITARNECKHYCNALESTHQSSSP
ncbi:MAG: hypothetical protein CK424_06120 [Legionella sp.]|nr:MAG: hypothetical protein CK424_06120 [Legionella sp.]